MMKFSRRSIKLSDFILPPYIEVVFLFLICFSVPAIFQINSNLIVGLLSPESKRLTDTEKLSTRLVTKEDSGFYISQELRFFERAREISSVIAKELGGLSPPNIVVSADELASHKSVVPAIEAAEGFGFEEIFPQTSLEKKISP